MSTFTTDWSAARAYWPSMFSDLAYEGEIHFLEIGCFEGRTTLWLIENILTHEEARITVIDTFTGSEEFNTLSVDGDSWPRFERNLAGHIDSGKVIPYVGRSEDVLRTLEGPFDFVYVDGSHLAADVLSDAVLAWPLLMSGGVMVFDDYTWEIEAPEWAKPRMAVDAFVRAYEPQLVVRYCDLQLVVEKR